MQNYSTCVKTDVGMEKIVVKETDMTPEMIEMSIEIVKDGLRKYHEDKV